MLLCRFRRSAAGKNALVVPALPREDTTDLVAAAAEVVVVALVREWGRKGLGGIIFGVPDRA